MGKIWVVEYTDEFEVWWNGLTESEQDDIAATVGLLEEKGPTLPFPYSSGVTGSKHNHMRELRIQHAGRPYRILYAFDPRRSAILLIGGNKTGNDRWYDRHMPQANKLYDDHIRTLKKEGLIP
ncbi:type II toxin-antitoxin system RelE/ParE family toxin [Oscillatoria laete-virens NRMC-F 0139]|nr:type II toxin-antitoxin system RelE/ParE family toxin [Oscillatoria laete-virens]MDL5054626.1 type II toxin-antitoxin system RelE/ParE family toxin [Oscillatoria laete-virens NRMC-F 0139]